MPDVVLVYAKAWAALIGSVLTALAGALPDVPTWLPVVIAVLTAVATYQVPNAVPGLEPVHDHGDEA